VDLVIRDSSIEVSYVGRPAGGIGGLQWFLDPRKTVMEELVPGRPDSLLKGRGILLVEELQNGRSGTTLALDVDSKYDEVRSALLTIGVHERTA
jgi:hypothetical protein